VIEILINEDEKSIDNDHEVMRTLIRSKGAVRATDTVGVIRNVRELRIASVPMTNGLPRVKIARRWPIVVVNRKIYIGGVIA
jgi:hypothetical protein